MNECAVRAAGCVASLWLFLALSLSSGAQATGAQSPAESGHQRQRLGHTEILDRQYVFDPQISPDGRQVVFSKGGWKAGRALAEMIWIVNADGGETRPLMEGLAPRWAPDGQRLLYIHGDSAGVSQIFVREMSSGATTQVTDAPRSVSYPEWSPDGKWISYRTLVVVEDAWDVGIPELPDDVLAAAPPEGRVVDRITYQRDGGEFLEPGWDHLFMVWSYQELVDTDSRLFGCGFECIRANTAQMLMSSCAIVERFYVVLHVIDRELSILVDSLLYAFLLQAAKEGFGNCVVPAVTPTTHAWIKLV